MSNHIEFEEFLTPQRVEWAYGHMLRARETGRQSIADAGWRAAKARDSKLLKALERGSEVVYKLSENQMGQTRRADGGGTTASVEHTEATMWREAYRLCDEGNPIQNFEWIYGTAAILCGYVS